MVIYKTGLVKGHSLTWPLGSLNEQLRQLLERLDQEAAKYTNSKVNDDESREWDPWVFPLAFQTKHSDWIL